MMRLLETRFSTELSWSMRLTYAISAMDMEWIND